MKPSSSQPESLQALLWALGPCRDLGCCAVLRHALTIRQLQKEDAVVLFE